MGTRKCTECGTDYNVSRHYKTLMDNLHTVALAENTNTLANMFLSYGKMKEPSVQECDRVYYLSRNLAKEIIKLLDDYDEKNNCRKGIY